MGVWVMFRSINVELKTNYLDRDRKIYAQKLKLSGFRKRGDGCNDVFSYKKQVSVQVLILP